MNNATNNNNAATTTLANFQMIAKQAGVLTEAISLTEFGYCFVTSVGTVWFTESLDVVLQGLEDEQVELKNEFTFAKYILENA